jgi:putative transposase
MPRKARIDYPGLTHHIMARTFGDLLLFVDEADRNFYLACLSRRIRETGFLCYAWALMRTHVHLLIRTSDLPLWRLMKPLNGDYAHYYNKKYERRGPLFGDRYKSIATQDQNYLERLVRYIHLNPIRARVCKTIGQLDRHPWSGHRAIVENRNNGFQEIKQVLARFGKTAGEARKNYRDFIEAGIERDE